MRHLVAHRLFALVQLLCDGRVVQAMAHELHHLALGRRQRRIAAVFEAIGPRGAQKVAQFEQKGGPRQFGVRQHAKRVKRERAADISNAQRKRRDHRHASSALMAHEIAKLCEGIANVISSAASCSRNSCSSTVTMPTVHPLQKPKPSRTPCRPDALR